MAVDSRLAEQAVDRGTLLLRIYGWQSSALSLGAFQSLAEAEASTAVGGLPLVRRPSGGGAIVHGTDLTYAAAVPRTHPWGATPQLLYDALHGAMVEVLRERGLDCRLWRPQGGPAADPAEAALLCFDRRSSGDVVIDRPDADRRGQKLMGSAQRRLQAAVLQHGSLLLRRNPDLTAGCHPGLADLAGSPDGLPEPEIVDRWLATVAARLGAVVNLEPVRDLQMLLEAGEDWIERFRDPRWTGRR